MTLRSEHTFENGVELKRCSRCKDSKPICEFNKHRITWDGLETACRACISIRMKQHYEENSDEQKAKSRAYAKAHPEWVKKSWQSYWEENKEDLKAAHREWYSENAEHATTYAKQYRQEHPEEVAAYKKQYRIENAESVSKSEKAYRESHKEHYRQWAKDWAKRHPHKVRIQHSKRKALENNCEGSYTAQEWEDLVEKYEHTCLCCRKQEPELILTVDHVIPLTRGGTNEIKNIQPLCRPCNAAKGNRRTTDYRITWEADKEQEAEYQQLEQVLAEYCAVAESKIAE